MFFSAGVFFAGWTLGELNVEPEIIFDIDNPEEGKPENVDFSLFWRAWSKLTEKFVNQEKLDKQSMVYGAISGLVKSLKDPYTVFFPPEEAEKFRDDVTGAFEGVGMEIGIKRGQLQIIAPLEGTPAQKAGLRPGDKIMEIDGESTLDLTIDEAVNLIRGPRGTEVILTIFREEWDENREIKLRRQVIIVPTLKWEIKEQNIAHLRLFQFSERAGDDFEDAAKEVIKSGARGIVLDLRNNPGGYLKVSQDIAGWFLKKGDTVAIEDFLGKKEKNIYKAQGNAKLADYPIVILINGGSASAAEILAGALRDNRGIILIGEKSFGKGSVQELEDLKDGSSLKITVANWLTPKGNLISDKGLEPDIKVEITDKNIEEEKDPQLDKALETIKKIL